MKTVLITGGSEGIGRKLAEHYASDGYHILLAARNTEKLERAKAELEGAYPCRVTVCPADLALPDSALRLYEMINREGIVPDEVVCNAGIGFAGPFWERSLSDDDRLVALNITAVMDMCKLFGRDMIARDSGRIILVSSSGAFQPGPYIAAYYASKAFVNSYGRAMAYELRHTNVRVSVYCPGPVRTAFYERSGGVMPPFSMSAEEAADYLYRHREDRQTLLIPGFMGKAAMFLPSSVRMRMITAIKDMMKKKSR